MKKLIVIFFVLFGIVAKAQFNPSIHVVINDALGQSQSAPIEGRGMFFDAVNFKWRDFQSTAEVLATLPTNANRFSHFPVWIHVGGTLSGGVWTGGISQCWFFKDGLANGNLVRWYTDSTGVAGALLAANNLSDLANITTAKTNLSLQNVDNTSDATKNAAAVSLTNHIISGALNTFSNIPNSALSNSQIGLSITGNAASNISVTTTPASLGSSLGINIPDAGLSQRGALKATDFVYFSNKIDSVHISNDSVYDCIAGVCTLRGVVSGGAGSGITNLNGLTVTTQIFTPGTSGTDFNINSSGSTHTFNFPDGSASNRGLITSTDWSTFNGKQPQLNGTGFVKATGTSISYDNSTYLTNITGLVTAGTNVSIGGSGTVGSPYVVSATGGAGLATASGDASGTVSGTNLPLTFATVNGNVGTFGSASSVAQFTTNAKGLTTAASPVAIQIAESQVTNLVTDLAGKQATGNYITSLTTDVVASGPGAAAATIQPNAITTGKIINSAVTLPKLANGTANTLIGYDASGVPIGISLTTTGSSGAATISAGVINIPQYAGGGSQTFQQTLTTGNVLTKADTINQSNNNFVWMGGGLDQHDSIYLLPSLFANKGFTNVTALFSVGNSITFGLNATSPDSNYVRTLARNIQRPAIDSGVSSTLTPTIASMHLRNVSFPNTYASSIMGGFNNARISNMITNRAADNNIINSYKAVWWNQFAKAVQNATSGTGVTRSGPWSTTYNAVVNAGGKTTAAAFTSTATASITYAFTDSTVGALLEIPVTTATAIDVKIDGVTVQTLNPTGKWDGAGAVGSVYGLFPIIITGLTNASHTLTITNTSGGLFIVDCFTSFVPSSTAPALIFFHAPKQNAAGYAANAGTPYSNAAADTLNSKIDSLAAALPIGWPLYVAKTNSFYSTVTGISVDNIHPNNLGHAQMASSAISALSGIPISDGSIVSEKNVDGTLNGYYGSVNGVKKRFDMSGDVGLQNVLLNNNLLNGPTGMFGSNSTFEVGNFSTFDIDSLLIINKSAGTINATGQLLTTGPVAGILIGNRVDQTKGFQFVSDISKQLALFDAYNSETMMRWDTSYRINIYNEAYTHGSFTGFNAALNIMGNQNGLLGHAPLQLGSGIAVSTISQDLIENDSTNLLYSHALPSLRRDTIALRSWVEANFSTIGGGGGNPFADNTALVKNNSDNTKLLILSAASITTATTRTATFPDANITVADKLSPLSQFASTTSAQLLGVISDETGTGPLVFGTSPSIATPLLTGLTSSGANDSMVTVDPTTGQTHRRSGTKTINFANGVTAPTTDSVYRGGSFIQNTTTTGGGFRLSEGTLGSHISTYNLYSDTIALSGSVLFSGGNPTNANFTVANEGVLYLLPTITANRTITLPSASTEPGRVLVFPNFNGSSFNWSFATTVQNADASVVSTLTNGYTYILEAHGSQGWLVVSRTSSNAGGINNYLHTITTPTTGGTVNLVNNQYNIINPAGALVALTVNLPSGPVNNDVVYIKLTQTVSTLTYANGTVVDGIASPVSGSLVVLTFDSATSSWY